MIVQEPLIGLSRNKEVATKIQEKMALALFEYFFILNKARNADNIP